jgi:ribosomal protein S12 methylthiotransferase accessory factor
MHKAFPPDRLLAEPNSASRQVTAESLPAQPLGPSDSTRSRTAESLLPTAWAAAVDAGVTRLAEVTRLDRFGLPVWQAIRPMSRALSVHQGKGATDADAQIGALLEAVESHAAETYAAAGPLCRFDALPERERAFCLSDFARVREWPPADDAEYRWTAAEDLVAGGVLHLPFDLVSLDLTRAVPSPFDRSSNGVATGASRDDAILAALHEYIERDAVAHWQEEPLLARMACTLDPDSAPFAWLGLWCDRIAAAGAALRFYRVPTLTGTPLFACEINDLDKEAHYYRAGQGRGCHPVPEVALFKALAEALQARLTVIAGGRDDLFPADYAPPADGAVRVAFGLPLPPSMDGLAWDEVTDGPDTPAALVGALARAGYPQVAALELAAPHGLSVIRAFVCGLGSMRRRRREPA